MVQYTTGGGVSAGTFGAMDHNAAVYEPSYTNEFASGMCPKFKAPASQPVLWNTVANGDILVTGCSWAGAKIFKGLKKGKPFVFPKR